MILAALWSYGSIAWARVQGFGIRGKWLKKQRASTQLCRSGVILPSASNLTLVWSGIFTGLNCKPSLILFYVSGLHQLLHTNWLPSASDCFTDHRCFVTLLSIPFPAASTWEMGRVVLVPTMGMPHAQSQDRVSGLLCIIYRVLYKLMMFWSERRDCWQTTPSVVKSILIFANIEANGGGVF